MLVSYWVGYMPTSTSGAIGMFVYSVTVSDCFLLVIELCVHVNLL
jgi:hypothetical protein